MSEKSYVSLSLTMGHLTGYCDLSNYAILSFLYHHAGDKFPVQFTYYTHTHTSCFILKIFIKSKVFVTTKYKKIHYLTHWPCLKTR